MLTNLANDLIAEAIARTDSPTQACSALLAAAGSILECDFGPEGALALLRASIDDADRQVAEARGLVATCH